MREVTDAELNEAKEGMAWLNANLDRYRSALDKMADWPEIAEDEADNVVQLIFAAATALDELAAEAEGLERPLEGWIGGTDAESDDRRER